MLHRNPGTGSGVRLFVFDCLPHWQGSFFFKYLSVSEVNGHFACMYTGVRLVPKEARGTFRNPGTGVRAMAACGCWDSSFNLLEEQPESSSEQPSLQPPQISSFSGLSCFTYKIDIIATSTSWFVVRITHPINL